MNKIEYQLGDQEYIELNKVLKILRLVNSGGEANLCIDEGMVTVNKVKEFRRRRKLRNGDTVLFKGSLIVVVI